MNYTMILLEPRSYQQISGAPVIFLAGPMHGAPAWQPRAFDLIRELTDDVVVGSPRRFHSVEHYRFKQPDTLRYFPRQRPWERYLMDLAGRQGCVMFWLPGPAGPLDGMVYGATTRFELGMWAARYAANPSLGLCVGTDGEFPTVHTIAWDLEHEMHGRTLHRSLEATVREAVNIARESFASWVAAGSPPVEPECALEEQSHEDHSLAKEFARLADNPMNDPDAIRRKALSMLRADDDWSNLESVDVETLDMQPANGVPRNDGAPDADEPAELEDLPEDADPGCRMGMRARERMVAEMRATGAWYLVGQRIDRPKYLAIGRSKYYIAFLQRLAVELGAPVYQSDFMEWIDPAHPEISLMYYLKSAQRIDVNLEGVSPNDLRGATIEAGRAKANRSELRIRYMTSWEINQLYYSDRGVPVFWHTGGSMSLDEAYDIIGARVPREAICED